MSAFWSKKTIPIPCCSLVNSGRLGMRLYKQLQSHLYTHHPLTHTHYHPLTSQKVHLLDYNEDIGVLDKTVFMHSAGEIWWAVNRPAKQLDPFHYSIHYSSLHMFFLHNFPPSLLAHPPSWHRHLSSCPADRDLLCTCYGVVEEGRGRMAAALWRLGEEGEDHTPLVEVGPLTHEGNVRW